MGRLTSDNPHLIWNMRKTLTFHNVSVATQLRYGGICSVYIFLKTRYL